MNEQHTPIQHTHTPLDAGSCTHEGSSCDLFQLRALDALLHEGPEVADEALQGKAKEIADGNRQCVCVSLCMVRVRRRGFRWWMRPCGERHVNLATVTNGVFVNWV